MSQNPTKKISTLANGLTVVSDTITAVDSVALGAWVGVGTRYESMQHNGIAHMVEHMMFNGTHTRNAQEISTSIEQVGGQMNAYTSRETTAYYVHLLKDHASLATEIIADMITHSTFPEDEIEKERGVIAQEIGMSLDTPDDFVFDLHQNISYPEQSLGAPILGTTDIINNLNQQDFKQYVSDHYHTGNMVLAASGNIQHDDLCALGEKFFIDLPQGSKSTYQPARYIGGTHHEEKPLEQTHIVTGYQGVDKYHHHYYSAMLLSLIMGGGMASRLFQEIREKRGLAYSIYSMHSAYDDDGQFEIYAGTGPDTAHESIDLIQCEIDKICKNHVETDELNRAKAQLKSSIVMGQESMLSRTNRMAKYFLAHGQLSDTHSLIKKIDTVTIDDIKNIANLIFNTPCTTVTLGSKK